MFVLIVVHVHIDFYMKNLFDWIWPLGRFVMCEWKSLTQMLREAITLLRPRKSCIIGQRTKITEKTVIDDPSSQFSISNNPQFFRSSLGKGGLKDFSRLKCLVMVALHSIVSWFIVYRFQAAFDCFLNGKFCSINLNCRCCIFLKQLPCYNDIFANSFFVISFFIRNNVLSNKIILRLS